MLYMMTIEDMKKQGREMVKQVEAIRADLMAKKAANKGKPTRTLEPNQDEGRIERARQQWYGQ